MGLAKLSTELYTSEEYLEMERQSTIRQDFLDGEIYAMAGESLSHSRICINLAGEVRNKLKGKSCEALSPNMKVRTSTASLFSYPDLTIVCGEPQFHDTKKDVLTNPSLIIGVLSDSTESFARGAKFTHYKSIESVTEYLLVAQDRPHVTQFIRHENGF